MSKIVLFDKDVLMKIERGEEPKIYINLPEDRVFLVLENGYKIDASVLLRFLLNQFHSAEWEKMTKHE